ncbi:MAG: hypothetical protein FJW23_10600 [Acidimicrobiia bacterium]|nr:hypothetical protein [Acidimicrobiia bacterium]
MAVTLWVALALYILHQDFWFWDAARPLVLGFVPIGLFYHAAYTLAVSAVLAWLVRAYWPAHLEDPADAPRPGSTRSGGA